MSGVIDLYYEFASPYSYIAAQRLPALATRLGLTVRWRPIELGKVWAEQGILDAYRKIQSVKRGYILADARRVAASLGVALTMPAAFPPDATLARLAVHGLEAREPGLGGVLTLNLWQRLWGQGVGISTREDFIATMPNGLDLDRLLAVADDPGSRERLDAANADAIASSCFGVPWLVADGEAYFGQDRLELMERRLAASLRGSIDTAGH
jgi:2-hydroxychromene-2-carboxylate isomerase